MPDAAKAIDLRISRSCQVRSTRLVIRGHAHRVGTFPRAGGDNADAFRKDDVCFFTEAKFMGILCKDIDIDFFADFKKWNIARRGERLGDIKSSVTVALIAPVLTFGECRISFAVHGTCRCYHAQFERCAGSD